MGKKLVIAEKPSVARDYAEVLKCHDKKDGYIEGNEYVVTWAFGHLFTLKEPGDYNEKYLKWEVEDLPIIPESFEIKLLNSAAKQFKMIKDLIKRDDIEGIIIGTDAGREGELIARYILLGTKNNKPVERLWLSTLTEADIKKGFADLKPIADYDNLFFAAAARSEIDWLLGMNYTRAYTKKRGNNVLLSIGRCQTPMLNMIVQRDFEIQNFSPEPYYEIKASFGDYSGKYVKEKETKIINKHEAEEIKKQVENKIGLITKVEVEKKSKAHPQLYNLTNLQRRMNKKYGFSAQKTLDIAQVLYEKHKIISYPRTSSRCLSESMVGEFKDRISILQFDKFKTSAMKIDIDSYKINKRLVDDTKISDHHAIIPTLTENIQDIYKNLNQDEKVLFDEIVTSFLCCFYPDYIYESVKIFTSIEGHEFLTTGKRELQRGWREIYCDNDENEEETHELPNVKEGEARNVIKVDLESKMTQPSAKFTEDSLLSQLEKYGIGTEATRANLIETLIKREYVQREKKNLASTQLGKDLIKAIDTEQLKSIELTAKLENRLENIAKGIENKDDLLKDIEGDLKQQIEKIVCSEGEVIEKHNENLGICPACKLGQVVENKSGYGCTQWKEGCKFFIKSEVAGKKISVTQIKKLIAKGKTDVIKGFTSKNEKTFDAMLTIKDGQVTFEFRKK